MTNRFHVVFYASTHADSVEEAVQIALEQVKTKSCYVAVDEGDQTSVAEGMIKAFLPDDPDEDVAYTVDDWKGDVCHGHTTLGYADWLREKRA